MIVLHCFVIATVVVIAVVELVGRRALDLLSFESQEIDLLVV